MLTASSQTAHFLLGTLFLALCKLIVLIDCIAWLYSCKNIFPLIPCCCCSCGDTAAVDDKWKVFPTCLIISVVFCFFSSFFNNQQVAFTVNDSWSIYSWTGQEQQDFGGVSFSYFVTATPL